MPQLAQECSAAISEAFQQARVSRSCQMQGLIAGNLFFLAWHTYQPNAIHKKSESETHIWSTVYFRKMITEQNIAIRETTQNDFEAFYRIWEEGYDKVFGDAAIDIKTREPYYRKEFEHAIAAQDDTFKIWGAFYGNELLGWMSVLPCRPGPFVRRQYGEVSTYISRQYRSIKVGMALGEHLVKYAREKSELWHLETYIGEKNLSAMKLAMNFGFVPVGAMPQGNKDKLLGKVFIWALAL